MSAPHLPCPRLLLLLRPEPAELPQVSPESPAPAAQSFLERHACLSAWGTCQPVRYEDKGHCARKPHAGLASPSTSSPRPDGPVSLKLPTRDGFQVLNKRGWSCSRHGFHGRRGGRWGVTEDSPMLERLQGHVPRGSQGRQSRAEHTVTQSAGTDPRLQRTLERKRRTSSARKGQVWRRPCRESLRTAVERSGAGPLLEPCVNPTRDGWAPSVKVKP